jgi:hypothetical protein
VVCAKNEDKTRETWNGQKSEMKDATCVEIYKRDWKVARQRSAWKVYGRDAAKGEEGHFCILFAQLTIQKQAKTRATSGPIAGSQLKQDRKDDRIRVIKRNC